MKKLIFTLFVLNFFILPCRNEKVFAQSQFQITIGGSDIDFANSITATADGGYIAAGYTESFGAGGRDIYLVKIDADGAMQWTKTIGGSGDEDALSIITTADGGFAVCGYTNTYGAGGSDMYILKFDVSGALQWTKVIGDEINNSARSIAQTPDGGYIAGGFSVTPEEGYSGLIVKLDASGSLQWSRIERCENGGWSGRTVILTSDGGYALAGYGFMGSDNIDICVFKLDANGYPQWTKSVGGDAHDYSYSMIQTSDGGIAVAGRTLSFGSDAYIFKLDAEGTVQWTRTIGTASGGVTGWSITQSSDGGLVIVGTTKSSSGGGNDMLLFKLNAGGDLQWYKTTKEDTWNDTYCVISTGDGYITAGRSFTTPDFGGSDMYVVKTDADGKTCSNTRALKLESGTGGIFSTPVPVVSTPSLTVSGSTPVVGSGGTVTVFCSRGGGHGGHGHGHSPHINNSNTDKIQEPLKFALKQNYPNPFNPKTTISFTLQFAGYTTVRIYSVTGELVSELVNGNLSAGLHTVQFDGSSLPSGIYFYRLESSGSTEQKKMVLLK